MRTNIDIDDELMAEALRRSRRRPSAPPSRKLCACLSQTRRQGGLRKLRGKVKWEGDLDAMRTGRSADGQWSSSTPASSSTTSTASLNPETEWLDFRLDRRAARSDVADPDESHFWDFLTSARQAMSISDLGGVRDRNRSSMTSPSRSMRPGTIGCPTRTLGRTVRKIHRMLADCDALHAPPFIPLAFIAIAQFRCLEEHPWTVVIRPWGKRLSG